MNASVSPRREAWQRLIGGVFFRVLIILLILYTAYHCVIAATPRMTTAVVNLGEQRVMTEGEATIFREETVLVSEGNGLLLSYPLENGAKVSATSPLVTLYTTTLDEQTRQSLQQQLHTLDAKIVASRRAGRQYSYATSHTTTASLPRVHTDIREHILALSRMTQAKNSYATMQPYLAELMLSLDVYAGLTGADTGEATPLQALESERSALLSTVARSMREMTLRDALVSYREQQGLAEFSGYFYHADSVDGYERVFLRDALATMNIMEYDMAHAAPPISYEGRVVLGKTVGSYAWSITLPVAFDVADTLTTGQTYAVCFPLENNTTVDMTLDRIIRSVGDGRAILILSADTMPQGFRFVRFQTAQLVVQTVRGYRIPDTALHTEQEREFVYVLQDGSVRLRDVSVLLRGEGYVIVAVPQEQEQNGLSLHDVVITSGKDLYDGKYID